MTLKVRDIIKLLKLIRLYSKNGHSSKQYVQNTYNDEPVKNARLPNYEETETLCKNFNLITVNDDQIYLTKLGEKFVDESKKNQDDKKIKELIIKECLLTGNYGEKILETFAKFYLSKEGKQWYPKWQVYDLFDSPEILPIIYEVGILEKKEITVEIDPKISVGLNETLERHLKQFKITQQRIDAELESKKIIGDIGEKIVLTFEKSRLRDLGFVRESEQVKLISQEFANAGYDICSFDGKNQDLAHDRFIEVKSSVGNKMDFHWSIKEINTAKTLDQKYWLYFVPEIDVDKKTSSKDPIMIQNPYSSIFSNSNFDKVIEGYHITKKSNVEL